MLRVFPDAKVHQVCGGHGVTISTKEGTQLVSVAQRDLYAKYKWPATDTIVAALEQHKQRRPAE